MKKGQMALPNLNMLYMRQKSYKKHQVKLKTARSQYQDNRVHSYQKNYLSLPKIIQEQNKNQYKQRSTMHSPLVSSRVISPYQKKKMSERLTQNKRLKTNILTSSSSIECFQNKSYDQTQIIKQRICKFIRAKNSTSHQVQYKYERYLHNIEKQKKFMHKIPHYSSLELKDKLDHQKNSLITRSTHKINTLLENQIKIEENPEYIQHQNDPTLEVFCTELKMKNQDTNEEANMEATHKKSIYEIQITELQNSNFIREQKFRNKNINHIIERNKIKFRHLKEARKDREMESNRLKKSEYKLMKMMEEERYIEEYAKATPEIQEKMFLKRRSDMEIVKIIPIDRQNWFMNSINLVK